MKIYFENKLISIGGDSNVVNEQNEKLFFVDGKAFSFTKKKHIYDEDKNYVLSVRKKFWHFLLNTIYVYDKKSKERILSIKQKFMSRIYKVKSENDEYEVYAEFFKGFYIKRNGVVLARFYNNRIVDFDVLGDSFCIETECTNKDDLALIVAVVCGFDIFKDEGKRAGRVN